MKTTATVVGIRLQVNGEPQELEVDVAASLLDLLRDHLGLTGTKRGCDQGECGACTVLLDGEPVNSCMLLAVDAAGRSVLTIEGLAGDGLHPIQQAFVDSGAVQCGFCTPGMILSAKAFLDRRPGSATPPDAAEVRLALSGNLCRCTGYQKIIDAVLAAHAQLTDRGGADD
jgi:aerobic-type carbon monoxide dehydrogenase small subunit (CoxS/CutS family)